MDKKEGKIIKAFVEAKCTFNDYGAPISYLGINRLFLAKVVLDVIELYHNGLPVKSGTEKVIKGHLNELESVTRVSTEKFSESEVRELERVVSTIASDYIALGTDLKIECLGFRVGYADIVKTVIFGYEVEDVVKGVRGIAIDILIWELSQLFDKDCYIEEFIENISLLSDTFLADLFLGYISHNKSHDYKQGDEKKFVKEFRNVIHELEGRVIMP